MVICTCVHAYVRTHPDTRHLLRAGLSGLTWALIAAHDLYLPGSLGAQGHPSHVPVGGGHGGDARPPSSPEVGEEGGPAPTRPPFSGSFGSSISELNQSAL